MADSRPTVLVTESEYRKAEPSFVSAAGLACLRAPDDEADLAAALRETPAASVIVGPRPYTGPLYDALPQGGVIARFGVGHDNIDKRKATAAGLLCTNTPGVLNQSVAEHDTTRVGSGAWRRAPGEDTRDRRVRWHRARRRADRGAWLRHAGGGLFEAGPAAARGAGTR